MSRNKKAVGLLGALFLTLALLPTLDQPPRQAVDDGPETAQILMFVGMSIDGGANLEGFGTLGGLMGAALAAIGELGGVFGWFSVAAAEAVIGAAVITMGFAA